VETEGEAAGVRAADERELLALSVAYAACADARDGEGLAALFTEDGALVVPRPPSELRPVMVRSGHDALAQVASLLGRYERTFHLVSTPRFEVDSDEATGEVPCVAHHLSSPAVPGAADPGADGPAGTDTVWFIRYRDRYRRAGSVWRIVRRELHLQWVEEHPVTLLGTPPD
jgi:hypothetical protein